MMNSYLKNDQNLTHESLNYPADDWDHECGYLEENQYQTVNVSNIKGNP